jgi:hypothetical protein
MASSVVLLGYALLFGTIEEHFLYFLFVPAALCVCIGAVELNRRTPAARRRVVAGLLGGLLVLDLAGSAAAYAVVRSRSDDGIARLIRWMDENVPPRSRVAVTTGVQEFVLTPRYDVTHWVSSGRLRADRIGYVVLSTRHVSEGYAFAGPAAIRYLNKHAVKVAAFSAPSDGELRVYRVAEGRSGPARPG